MVDLVAENPKGLFQQPRFQDVYDLSASRPLEGRLTWTLEKWLLFHQVFSHQDPIRTRISYRFCTSFFPPTKEFAENTISGGVYEWIYCATKKCKRYLC